MNIKRLSYNVIISLCIMIAGIPQNAYAQNKKNKTFRLATSTQYVMPAGYYEDLVSSGYGITIQTIIENSITQDFFVGADLQYIYFNGKNRVTDHARFLPVSLLAGYCFTNWQLSTIPYLGFGATYTSLYRYKDSLTKEYEEENQLRPHLKVGIQVEYHPSDRASLLIGTEYETIIESDSRIIYLSYNAGFSLRF